jgi:hypothetical protein
MMCNENRKGRDAHVGFIHSFYRMSLPLSWTMDVYETWICDAVVNSVREPTQVIKLCHEFRKGKGRK